MRYTHLVKYYFNYEKLESKCYMKLLYPTNMCIIKDLKILPVKSIENSKPNVI